MYAELHCHSALSLLDGASTPESLVLRAAQLSYRALAITDHDELGGVVRFGVASRNEGLNGILGVELTVNVPDKSLGTRTTHIILLAETREGYSNISTLVTAARMHTDRGSPSVPWDKVVQHSQGVTVLTGCPRGWIPQLLSEGREQEAWHAAQTMYDVFDKRLAVECWDHRLSEERALVRMLIPLAQKLGVPWVVTNNVHYAHRKSRIVHDVLTALRHGCTLDEMGTRLRPNAEWALKSIATLRRQWSGAEEGLAATLVVAERCAFRYEQLKPSMPAFSLPHSVNANEYLKQLIDNGAHERWGAQLTPRQESQIAHEFDTITRLNLAGYFLIVWDIVRFALREGILCQGRGSAANSAVCYCLGITAVDPVKMNLLFERFLTGEREEPPDIDIDFAHRDRERVLQYVYEKYGREHAAMVCEQITWQGRSALRDAARVLGFSVQQGESLSKLVGRSSARSVANALRGEQSSQLLARAGLDPLDSRVSLLADIVEGLHQLPRHRSIHVGGFILTEEPLGSIVPVEPSAMANRTVVQWEKDDLGPAGLIKIDLLGLGMLTVVQDCLAYIRHTRGTSIDLGALDMLDQNVYDDMCRADTIGVFQIESRAQMNTLPRLKPRCFYDLVVEIALIRPGPIQGAMVHPYLRRKAGEEDVSYLYPSLEPILKRTLGVPLFQEQGMQVAIAAAGFTPHQADQLRRAMGHKRSKERMAAIGEQLLAGMKRNGIPEEVGERIFNQINAFSDYGFPESHAMSFALIVYATAFLRHYYAPEYLAAILNAQPMGFYSPSTLIEDAKRHGVKVLPIDLTKSAWHHSLELSNGRTLISNDGSVSWANGNESNSGNSSSAAVRLGLRLVRGLGVRARGLLETELANGPFVDIEDAVRRVNLDNSSWRKLAESGAFDSMFAHFPPERRRRLAIWEVMAAAKQPSLPFAPITKSRSDKQLPSFSAAALTESDFKTTGVSLNGHPMKHIRNVLTPNGVLTAKQLVNCDNGHTVAVAGLVICRQSPSTAKGFVFMTLEDETGLVNVIITPRRYKLHADTISQSPLLLVRGVIQTEKSVINIRAQKFRAISPSVGEQYVAGRDFK